MSDFGTMADERFHEISTLAWDCEPLPEKFIYKCDIQLYDDLANLYTGHRRDKIIDKKEVIARGLRFRAAYRTDLGVAMLHHRAYAIDQERYKRCAELRTQIVKSASEKTDFEFLSMCIELFAKAFTDVDAKVITKNLMQRSDSCMTPITEDSEGMMRELLLALRVDYKVVDHMFEKAKAEGQGSYNGFVVRPSGEKKFRLYHVPSAEYNKRS